LPHAKISGPQGGVKRLIFGCERQKSEFFMYPHSGVRNTPVGLYQSQVVSQKRGLQEVLEV
jgi:hypothetical protein